MVRRRFLKNCPKLKQDLSGEKLTVGCHSKQYVNTEIDFNGIGRKAENQINLAQVSVQWRAVMNTLMNLWVP
jgi:hypothetical protein